MEEIKAGNKYKYTEETERFKKMNRFYIAATSVLGCIFILYLWLKLSSIRECDGNLSQVASRLGVSRQTLYNKIKKYGL